MRETAKHKISLLKYLLAIGRIIENKLVIHKISLDFNNVKLELNTFNQSF